MEFIAFMIVGYAEISPGSCQLEYFRYNEIHSLVIPCHENGTLHQAIDNHTRLYFETGDEWHQEQAQILRKYIKDLKVWIHKEEGWWNE